MKLTEQKMSSALFNYLYKAETSIFFNIYALGGFESDFISISHDNYLHEFEIKTNKKDFDLDFLKENEGILKHDSIQDFTSGLKTFSFVVPKGMVKEDEIPDSYGLYYISEKLLRVTHVRSAINLKRAVKVGSDLKLKFLQKSHGKYMRLLVSRHAKIKTRVEKEFWESLGVK